MPASFPLRPLLLGVLLAVSGVPLARADELTRQVQEELRKRKLYFGDVDGQPAEPVAAALRRYQQRKGFPATGQTDEVTLRSLSLEAPRPPGGAPAPAPAVPAGESAPPAPASVPAPAPETSPWPDMPVLRSDQASLTAGVNVGDMDAFDAAAGADPTPTPAPPPDAVSVRRPDEAQVRAYLELYLQAGAANDPPAEMRFYGGRVDYFENGPVDRRFIEADVNKYDHRWPERHFTLAEGLSITPASPEQVIVRCRVRFDARRPGFHVQGETENVFTLSGTGPENWRILGMKEQRVRGK